MTSRFGRIFATALSAVLVAPVFAQAADVLLPPYDGSQPLAEVVTDDEALAVLHRHGIAQVSTLGRVGDYWEGEGMLKGKPVIAYVFTDGALKNSVGEPGRSRSRAIGRAAGVSEGVVALNARPPSDKGASSHGRGSAARSSGPRGAVSSRSPDLR